MRPLKIPRDELLQRCASTFKRLGYNGATMDALSVACGLTKASFYHHYPSKDALLRDVLAWTHEQLAHSLFVIAHDAALPPRERLERMGRRASRLFLGDGIGCLMGVVAVDVAYAKPALIEPIRAFMDAWAAAFFELYKADYPEPVARALARQLVADYEGAILLARIQDDPAYVEAVTQRALAQLPAPVNAG